MKWTNITKEGDRTINWVASTPFGDIRICSNGHRAMCIKHPAEDCTLIGAEFTTVAEAQRQALVHYQEALDIALVDSKHVEFPTGV